MSQPNVKHVVQALQAARAELTALPREGRYQYGSYLRAEDAIAIAREVLARHDLVLLVESAVVDTVGDQLVMRMHARLVHTASGAELQLLRSVPVVEGRGRPADKATLAAQTTAVTYLIRDVLLAPRREPYEIETLGDAPASDAPATVTPAAAPRAVPQGSPTPPPAHPAPPPPPPPAPAPTSSAPPPPPPARPAARVDLDALVRAAAADYRKWVADGEDPQAWVEGVTDRLGAPAFALDPQGRLSVDRGALARCAEAARLLFAGDAS